MKETRLLNVMICITIILLLTMLYFLRLIMYKGDIKGDVICNYELTLGGCHSTLTCTTTIYDSGIIMYCRDCEDDKKCLSKEITRQELRKLNNLIEKVPQTSSDKQSDYSYDKGWTNQTLGSNYGSKTIDVYNRKREKIYLEGNSSDESLITFVENLIEKYFEN